MRDIQMVDLGAQYERIRPEVDAAMREVLDSSAFIKGPAVQRFEEALADRLGVKHVIGCANGTDALQVAMMALGLKPGDEVITADFTYIATVEVIALLGLTPVVVDIDPDTYNLDAEKVRAAITDKTKAIVPVHLFGQSCDMDPILDMAREHELFVIEDNAQAIGAEHIHGDASRRFTGTIGDIGTTSFFPSKNLGCYGDGGAMMTDDDDLAARLRQVANHGQGKRYHFDRVGVNSRLDSLQAAVLNVKLPHLDDYIDRRRAAAAAYREHLGELDWLRMPREADHSTHVYHQFVVELVGDMDRDLFQKYLREHEIPCNIYYPIPVHRQRAYMYDVRADDLAVSVEKSKRVLALPMHTELDDEQIGHITRTIKEYR